MQVALASRLFLPQDAIHNAAYTVVRCLSVRLSVTFIVSK